MIRTLLLLEKAYIRELKQSGKPLPAPRKAPSKTRHLSMTQTLNSLDSDNGMPDELIAQDFLEKQLKIKIMNFRAELADGSLLCRLMKSLSPSTFPAAIHNKTTPFHRMENVQNFLNAARAYGISEQALFKPSAFLERGDIHGVVSTLLALAQQAGHQTATLRRALPSTLLTSSSSKLSSVPRLSIGDHDLAKVVEHLSKRSTTSSHHSSPFRATAKPQTPSTFKQDLATVYEDLRGVQLMVPNGETAESIVYQIGNCIGRGHFGTVYKGLQLSSGKMVAIKRIQIDESNAKEADTLMQEVDLLKSLDHPNIVKYEGFLQDNGVLNIILEFVENGSLYHTIKQFGAFPENLVVYYAVGMLRGLMYLHARNVIHRDLKAANILTTKDGTVKLSDFGVSKELNFDEKDTSVAGTPNWMSPEVIELKGASTASDIWSLGCTVLELVTGRAPFSDCNPMTVLFRIVEDDHPPMPSTLSPELRDFLMCCFRRSPAERWTAVELMEHPWIRKNYSATSEQQQPRVTLVESVQDNHASRTGSGTTAKKSKGKHLKRRQKKGDGKKCVIS